MRSPHTPMNVLMVLGDQHHADLMGCAGHPQAITPNMDRLAAHGMRLTQAYAQCAICTPSRVSILSGQYCHNHGHYGNHGPAPAALPNLFGHFRAHGYRTAALGSLSLPGGNGKNWIAGDVDLFGDAHRGANGDESESLYYHELEKAQLRHLDDSRPNEWYQGQNANGYDARPSELPYEHTLEIWSARRTMSFIDESPDRPFFIQTAFIKPHHPLLPQKKFWDLYPADLDLPPTFNQDPSHRPPHFQHVRRYLREMKWDYGSPGETYMDGARRAWRGTLACISQIDDALGMLLDYLDERGLAERTIVIYGSDHGGYHTIHGLPEKAPGICSNAVCRVPMIWRVPGITPGGAVRPQLVENIDMAATLPALCGLPPMDSADGRDLSSLLGGDEAPIHDAAVTELPWSKSIRWGPWRLVHYQPEMFASFPGFTPGQDVGELYNMESDPNETHNLYAEAGYKNVVEQGRRLLLEWLIRTTRVVTCHPPQSRDGKTEYDLAGDGKETRLAGPAGRVRRGLVYYI